MITFNHEKYIKTALKGVLMQKANFEIEVIVANDCSPDASDKIIQDVISEHFNGHLVKYTRHSTNKGMLDNFIWALKQCTGKYIALCEGDDYWIDPLKLQKQVDILEANPSFSFCFHQAIRLNTVKHDYSVYPIIDGGTFSPEDFFTLTTIPMASVVFSNQSSVFFLKDHSHPDFQLLCHLMTNGKAFFLKEVMSVYRVHENGVSYNNHQFFYVKRRADELYQETKIRAFSREVRKQVIRICIAHTHSMLKAYRDHLSLGQRLHYRSRLLRLSDKRVQIF